MSKAILAIYLLATTPTLAYDSPCATGMCQPMIFENVPLMFGLMVIDRQDGGPNEVAVYKVIAEASGSITADDIYDYYEYTLPKHHWEAASHSRGMFINNAEELTITSHNSNDALTVTFKLHK